ncbi:uncharacterized protein LOC122251165 [Penaeus japonicus]|uniref:uncharacterized protein LOC122251165 n=1 Tax=Penaeus japonicus TaxID=27405 RepID=UPI001C70C1AB|nr:uncharacterized protein LOC122251165 [Penaeus japonicus]
MVLRQMCLIVRFAHAGFSSTDNSDHSSKSTQNRDIIFSILEDPTVQFLSTATLIYDKSNKRVSQHGKPSKNDNRNKDFISEPYIRRLLQAVSRDNVLSEPGTSPAMKLTAIALVCLAAAVVTHADPEPLKYHQYPYYHYYPQYHHLEPLQGDGVARHPGGGTSFVGPQVHGLTKRSADLMPEADLNLS